MFFRVQSYLLSGIDALSCEVEIDVDEGQTDLTGRAITVVGLPDAGVKESVERVTSALGNSGYFMPRGRVTINLAPADVRKEGPVYDLPIAIGLLASQGVVGGRTPQRGLAAVRERGLEAQRSATLAPPADGLDLRKWVIAGELALDGRVRPVKGAIALASMAKAAGMEGVIVPADNAAEAAVVEGIAAVGVRTLAEVVGILTGRLEVQPSPTPDVTGMLKTATPSVDFADVRGQEGVKRAILVAAAGSHNMLELWSSVGGGGVALARPCR
jgi:magnesium chelatase family protein